MAARDTKKKKGRKTRESGLFLRVPTARTTKKQAKPRKDSVQAMVDIYPHGWDYSEKVALENGTAEKGYYLHETLKVEISPEDAGEIFIHHNYAHQRNFDDGWARELARNMVTAVGIDFAIGPGGKAFVINGQHTLWAIYLRQRRTPASITVYQCRNEQAMADLYAIFDSNKVRTIKQVLHAAKNSNSLTYEGTENKLARWSQCAFLAENNFTRKQIGKQGNSKKVETAKREDVQEFAQWMDSHVTEAHHTKLVPQAVGAAFYAMFKSDLTNAEKFACGYFRGVGLEEGSPILIIRNKMINRPKNQHAASAGLELAQLMYSAWRKFCLAETLTNLRKTLDIPAFDKWRIYETSRKTITLAGNQIKVKVENR